MRLYLSGEWNSLNKVLIIGSTVPSKLLFCWKRIFTMTFKKKESFPLTWRIQENFSTKPIGVTDFISLLRSSMDFPLQLKAWLQISSATLEILINTKKFMASQGPWDQKRLESSWKWHTKLKCSKFHLSRRENWLITQGRFSTTKLIGPDTFVLK